MISTNRYTKRLRSHHDALASLRALVTPITDFAARLQEMHADDQPRTIYIHTPFCTHNCTFCNLNRCRERPPEEYAELIVREIETYAAYRYVSEGRYDAVYFGGEQVPTRLSTEDREKLLGFYRQVRGMDVDEVPYRYNMDKPKVWEYATRFYGYANR